MRIASRETKFSPAVRRQSVQQVQERRMTGLEWGYRSRFDELSRAQRIVIGRDRSQSAGLLAWHAVDSTTSPGRILSIVHVEDRRVIIERRFRLPPELPQSDRPNLLPIPEPTPKEDQR